MLVKRVRRVESSEARAHRVPDSRDARVSGTRCARVGTNSGREHHTDGPETPTLFDQLIVQAPVAFSDAGHLRSAHGGAYETISPSAWVERLWVQRECIRESVRSTTASSSGPKYLVSDRPR